MRFACFVMASAAVLSFAAQALADTIVVTAARMVDVIGGREVDKPQIVIKDDRITAVGKQGDPVPDGAKHIDLGNRTLLPGLIDMHVHLTSDPTISGYKGLQYTPAFWMVVGVANAKKTLDAGFTTVRNVGSHDFADVGLSAAEALDKTADVGAIEKGRYADLIAMDGDPLRDIKTLQTVAFVMKGGVVETVPAI